jgi:2-polyprenyl-6-methoxyphenol hydroxylase-like FAD-dependent oxidoreductase
MRRPAGIDFTDAAAATARVAAEFDGWTPELTALITDAETAPIPRMIYTLPDGHRWDCVPAVMLLGDAAHLMPPAGEGANLAMFDASRVKLPLPLSTSSMRCSGGRWLRLTASIP